MVCVLNPRCQIMFALVACVPAFFSGLLEFFTHLLTACMPLPARLSLCHVCFGVRPGLFSTLSSPQPWTDSKILFVWTAFSAASSLDPATGINPCLSLTQVLPAFDTAGSYLGMLDHPSSIKLFEQSLGVMSCI